MPTSTVLAAAAAPPLRSPWLTVAAAWLVPGAGHFLLGKRVRAAIIFATVALSFAIGLGMNGPFFSVGTGGDVLSKLIQYGGFLGDLASGIFYLLAVLLGYGPPDQPGHVPDYGSKFLVAAGIFNILAMVDAYEIATRLKD
jgi:hypothetical protein